MIRIKSFFLSNTNNFEKIVKLYKKHSSLTSQSTISESDKDSHSQKTSTQTIYGGQKARGRVSTKYMYIYLFQDIHSTCIHLR